MFFKNIIPIFPVIHYPTFIFPDCPAPLLLNAIALGSLFLGTPGATIKVTMNAFAPVIPGANGLVCRRMPSGGLRTLQ